MWVAPIRVYHHRSRESIVPLYATELYGWSVVWYRLTGHQPWWWYIRYTPGVEWPALRDLSGKMFLCTPVYLSLEIHWSGGSSLPSHSWNPFSNKRRTVLIVPNYAEREMQAFSYFNMYLWFRHYYNIRWFWYKKWFGYRKGKTRPCLCAAWSYEIPLIWKVFSKVRSVWLLPVSWVFSRWFTRLIRVLFL